MITPVHTTEQGDVLGLDEQGIVHWGKTIEVSQDELVFETTIDGDRAEVTAKYQDQVVSRGSYDKTSMSAPDWDIATNPVATKVFVQAYDQDGNRFDLEIKARVIQWQP